MYNFCALCSDDQKIKETICFFSGYEFIITRANCPISSFLKNVKENLDFGCKVLILFHVDDYINIDEMDVPIYEYIFALRFFFSTNIIQLGEHETNVHPDYIWKEGERIDYFFNNIMMELSCAKIAYFHNKI